jgi:hypothetical protein
MKSVGRDLNWIVINTKYTFWYVIIYECYRYFSFIIFYINSIVE